MEGDWGSAKEWISEMMLGMEQHFQNDDRVVELLYRDLRWG
jgi:hypothetical protein